MNYGTTATCIKILSKSMNIAARKIYFMFVVVRGGEGTVFQYKKNHYKIMILKTQPWWLGGRGVV